MSRDDPRPGATFDECARTTHLLVGNRELKSRLAEIRDLRRRCGQEDDLTTDPEYFIAANTLKNRKCAAVLIRRDHELEACVLFYEHCRFGVGLGLFAGTAEALADSRRKPLHQSFRCLLHRGDGASE